jgi:hypothetical protein
MNNSIRLIAKTNKEEFEIDVILPSGDMFIIAIVPKIESEVDCLHRRTEDKRYISWAVCEHHKEENAVIIWHIQTLQKYRKQGYVKKLLTVLKANHDLLETNFETTNDDGYLCLIKEGFKEIKNILDNEKKVLQWKKQK